MQTHNAEYCTFQDMSALVLTWNAGACKPSDLREGNFFQDLLQGGEPPDLISFGLQELVDLENKKLTASMDFRVKSFLCAQGLTCCREFLQRQIQGCIWPRAAEQCIPQLARPFHTMYRGVLAHERSLCLASQRQPGRAFHLYIRQDDSQDEDP